MRIESDSAEGGPATAYEIAAYAGDMASQLADMARGAGLETLALAFAHAQEIARRAKLDESRRAQSAAGKAAADKAT